MTQEYPIEIKQIKKTLLNTIRKVLQNYKI